MLAIDRQLDIAVLEKAFFQHRGIGAKIGAAMRIADREKRARSVRPRSALANDQAAARHRRLPDQKICIKKQPQSSASGTLSS
jgi:hypothetical protein